MLFDITRSFHIFFQISINSYQQFCIYCYASYLNLVFTECCRVKFTCNLALAFSFLNFGDKLGELLSDAAMHLLPSLIGTVQEDPNLPTGFQEVLHCMNHSAWCNRQEDNLTFAEVSIHMYLLFDTILLPK